MRALTMDEVQVVAGGYKLQTYEDVQGGGLATLGITGYRPTPAQPAYTPTNNYLTPSFNSPSLMYGSFDSMNWCGPVNGGFASQDAQLQCYADWLNAGSPDIQGQNDEQLTEVVPTAKYVDAPQASRPWTDFINGPVAAIPMAQTVMYIFADGHSETISGNHPNRDNNPMDIMSGKFATNHGAIGSDNGFAIFATPEDGWAAALANMNRLNEKEGGLATLGRLVSVWSPPFSSKGEWENDTAAMIQYITSHSMTNSSDTWSSLSLDKQNSFMNWYAIREGYSVTAPGP